MGKENSWNQDEQDNLNTWADLTFKKSGFDYKAKLAKELEELQKKDGDGKKNCHCPSCSGDRMRQAGQICEKLTHLDTLLYPNRKEEVEYYVKRKEKGKGWDLAARIWGTPEKKDDDEGGAKAY